MVIDVESIGLHGEAFAVASVILQNTKIVAETCFACHPDQASGLAEDRHWVEQNCIGISPNCRDPQEVRFHFWKEWLFWKERGAMMIADCAWPVEGRFISRCINDNRCERNWLGPYPLHDVASMRLIKGLDPLATVSRLPDELPAHHPLHDARQSARMLMEIINDI